MSIFVGLDIHTRTTTVVAKTNRETCVMEKRIRNTPEDFEKVVHQLQEFDPHIIAGLESSINSSWVGDQLENLHVDFKIGNAFKLKHILAEEIKTDKVDGGHMADLLMTPLFPTSYHIPREVRYRRDMLRYRVVLRNLENYFKTVIWGVLLRLQTIPPMKDVFTKKGKEWLTSLQLPGHYNFTIKDCLDFLPIVQKRVKEVDKLIRPWQNEYPVAKLLQTIPGLGWFGSLLFYLEIHDIKRFYSPKKLSSYVGVVPRDQQSADHHYQIGLKRQCNRWLQWMAIQGATSQARRRSPIGKLYRDVKKRRDHAKAKVAAARHIVRSVYWVWTRNEPFKWEKEQRQQDNKFAKTYVLNESPNSL